MIIFGVRHHHLLNTPVGYARVPGAHSMMEVRSKFTAEKIFQEVSGYATRELSELVAVECDIIMLWIWERCDLLADNNFIVDALEISFGADDDLRITVRMHTSGAEKEIVFDLVRNAEGFITTKISASYDDREALKGAHADLTAKSERERPDELGLSGMGFAGLSPLADSAEEIFASIFRLRNLTAS